MNNPCCFPVRIRTAPQKVEEALESFVKSKTLIDSMCDKKGYKKIKVNFNEFDSASDAYSADKAWLMTVLEEAIGKGWTITLKKERSNRAKAETKKKAA